MDEQIGKFKVESQVAVWAFLGNKNYGEIGISVSGSREGLLALLQSMERSEWSSKNRFKTVQPDDDWIRKTGGIKVYDELEIALRKDLVERFEMIPEDRVIRFQLGTSAMQKFRQLLTDHAFDVGMDDDQGQVLMFW